MSKNDKFYEALYILQALAVFLVLNRFIAKD